MEKTLNHKRSYEDTLDNAKTSFRRDRKTAKGDKEEKGIENKGPTETRQKSENQKKSDNHNAIMPSWCYLKRS